MADAATDLAKDMAMKFTPLGWLDSILKQLPTGEPKKSPPVPRGPLPRIVPNEKGELIDLNTGKAVGRVSSNTQPKGDIYPLGQDQGLVTDVVNFALNNLYQYSNKFGETNQKRAQLFKQLKSGEKADPSLMRDLVQEATNVNPAGVIAPTGNRVLKGLFEELRKRAPGLVKQADELSQTVFPYLVPGEMMPVANSLGVFRRSGTMPKGEIHLRGARPQAEQVDTLGHELRHFLTGFDPKFSGKNPSHALETAQQLTEMMPWSQNRAMRESYLPSNEASPTILQNLARMKPGSSPHASNAYDESLAYLTEALMQGNKGGDPALEAIANALGQGIK